LPQSKCQRKSRNEVPKRILKIGLTGTQLFLKLVCNKFLKMHFKFEKLHLTFLY